MTSSAYEREAPPRELRVARDGRVVHLSGPLRGRDGAALFRDVRRAALAAGRGDVAIDLSEATEADGSILVLLVALRTELAGAGVRAELTGVPAHLRPVVSLYDAALPAGSALESHADEAARGHGSRRATIAQLGRFTLGRARALREGFAFLGALVFDLRAAVKRPRGAHLRAVPGLIAREGTDAIPIVTVISFLVGFVMGYQSARQLALYGANLYVADVVGLSVTRELAPLITAIILSGRSGAAFTAEIGSMNVSEEIDALHTLGVRPVGWLVLPRAIALVLVLPLLTLLADVVGVLGGLVVAATSLDVSPGAYVTELRRTLVPWDIEGGLLKSLLFAAAIALIACQQGFAARGGAEGVGRRTTSTVVIALLALVALDALTTALFRLFGV